ncbi:MAG: hypothetical protein H7123_07395, partial [Thermoleophilia bacterium]|nr:hypothetical protein [Thermoleophilia bacterium]
MNAIPQSTTPVIAMETRWGVTRSVNPQSIGPRPGLTAAWAGVKGAPEREPVTLPGTLTEYEDKTAAHLAAQALSYFNPTAFAVVHDAKDRWFTTPFVSPTAD